MTNKSNVCVAFVLNAYEFYQTPLKKYIFQFAFQSPANVFWARVCLCACALRGDIVCVCAPVTAPFTMAGGRCHVALS